MKIEILVSTMDQGFDLDAPRPAGVDVLVINQTTTRNAEAAERYRLEGAGQGIRVLNFEERGLSKSRNRAIAAAAGDICLIADDDISFVPDLAAAIRSAFARNPGAAVIAFKAVNEGGSPIKGYRAAPFKHSQISITGVTSFEIAFHRNKLAEKRIEFDERFGLGGTFVSGEENIFLLDCIKAELGVFFVPEVIAIHPGPTSGRRFEDDAVVVSKGAIVRRMYGKLSYPLAAGFAIRKSWQYRVNPLRMVALVSRGWFSGGR